MMIMDSLYGFAHNRMGISPQPPQAPPGSPPGQALTSVQAQRSSPDRNSHHGMTGLPPPAPALTMLCLPPLREPPMPEVLVRDLLDLPQHVSRGDFVQSLAESLRKPEETVRSYAVTGRLVENFREALRVVRGALDSGRSQPVFLHGSFGSGKSHFMAMLHLLLQGHPAPWRKPELHPLRDAYTPIEGKRLLQLHFHMLGAETFESAVFKGYVDFVRAHHPDAPLPGLFRDAEVFDNALQLRARLGDDAFFGALNQGRVAIPGFGRQGKAQVWTPERLDDALRSADPEQRRALFDDLVRTLLPAFAGRTDRFVDTDEGLGELSRHAASLGYHGVVLYLDELILWLASRSADMPFVQREINKLVKLKEARDEARTIPIVAFVARQRDLSELVGEGETGAERALIEETFGHHKSRFHTIELEDSNLRAIIPHRVVVARDAASRDRLEDGFVAMWRSASAALATLQGGTASQADFRQVYPFSPALVDALVALSDRLQRDRTAIRILVEMLVEHLPDLALGEVVPVGDIFDLVASAEDAVDGPSRAAFQRARDLYIHEILPRLQRRHDVASPERCQRAREGHPLRLGCSGCPVVACRNDNRLIKTALLAALVPRARPFDGLTVKRLVHLNHGAVKAPIEAMRVNLAAASLRDLAREILPIRLGEGGDPTVTVSLQSIDLKPILARADDQDTALRRRAVLRKMLFEQLGLSGPGPIARHPAEIHHTKRVGAVHFANVRLMKAAELRCPDGAEWQVVIDYPFDDEGYTPEDDERRVVQARDELRGGTPTLVWLPTFFSRAVLDDLGDLARLEHILGPDQITGFLSDIPPNEHQRARIDLESLRDRKRFEVQEATRKAYGLVRVSGDDAHLDANRAASEHVIALLEMDPRTPRGAQMADGLSDLAVQILEARYPRHPNFQAPPTPARLGRVVEALARVIEQGGGPVPADKDTREELARVGEPLRLCRVSAQQVELLDGLLDPIDARRNQAGVEDPTYEQIQGWIDPSNHMGLQESCQSAIAWTWALRHRRLPRQAGRAIPWPANAKLEPSVVFTRPDLPSEADFTVAIERAAVLGLSLTGRALNPRNLENLASKVREAAQKPASIAAAGVPRLLAARVAELGRPTRGHRARTAAALARLLAGLDARSDRGLVEALASVSLDGTSIQALARAWMHAPEVSRALGGSEWTVISLLEAKRDDDRVGARATALVEQLAEVLGEDELNANLSHGLREVVDAAGALLRGPGPEPTGWRRAWEGEHRDLRAVDALAALDRLREQLAAALVEAGDRPARVQVSVALEVVDEGGDR